MQKTRKKLMNKINKVRERSLARMSSRKVNSEYARIYARKVANMYTKKLHRKGSN